MSEANFILSALSGVKFRADSLMQKVVAQGNSQLDRPVADANNLPVGISEEIDDKILEVFTPIWSKDQNAVQFDFSKKGNLIAVVNVGGDLIAQLKQDSQAIADANGLILSVNEELEGGVVFVFSAPQEGKMEVVKEETPAAEVEAEKTADA